MLRRLAQRRSSEQAMPLLRRAYDAARRWAPRLLAEHLEAAGEFAQTEHFARLAANAGDRQALEELAARRKDDDPDRQWQTILANGLTAEGTPPPRRDPFKSSPALPGTSRRITEPRLSQAVRRSARTHPLGAPAGRGPDAAGGRFRWLRQPAEAALAQVAPVCVLHLSLYGSGFTLR